jgi:HK97 gp10 family phage protein
MAGGIDIKAELVGFASTRRLLAELPKRARNKALRAAVTAGGTPIQRAVKASAPRDFGILKQSIAKKVKQYRGAAVAIVGARKDVSQIVRRAMRKGDLRTARRATVARPANYLHLVEGGTKAHLIGKTHHPGSQAQPFLATSFSSTQSQAQLAAANKMAEVINAEAIELGK